jgi:vacuolar iron transporter family protein
VAAEFVFTDSSPAVFWTLGLDRTTDRTNESAEREYSICLPFCRDAKVIYEAEYAREREAVEYNEPEAREVLSLSYQVRGLSEEDANRFVDQVARDKTQLVQALARERLSTTEEGLRKPWTSAISGALSTALGALIPIVPFFFLTGYPAVVVAAIVSLLAHFAVGAGKSLITIRPWWSSGFEMTFVGAIEGLVTYMIGIMLGRISGAGI